MLSHFGTTAGFPSLNSRESSLLELLEEGRSKPALIQQWPRILANYDARFLLCAPAALQAHLLQIEENRFAGPLRGEEDENW